MKSKKRARPSSPLTSPVPPAGWAWWHYAASGTIAFLALFLIYQPALNGPFVFDDQSLPFFSPHFGEQTLAQATKGVRPLLMASFWINSRLAGIEPYSYHLWNVLIHFVNSILIFLLVRRLLAIAGIQDRLRAWLATFSGAVFLLHPVQTESVAYVASRSEGLSALFFYAAFAVFLYRRSPAISWSASMLVILLYGAAVSTKEHTITLPALLLLTDYFWNPGFSFQGIRRNWRLYAPLAAAAAGGVLLVQHLVKGSVSAGFNLAGLPWYDYFYTQCRALWVYMRLFVFPVGQNADYAYPYSTGILDKGAIIGLAGLLAAGACALYFRKRFPLAAYGFLAAIVMFTPTSSFVPIQDALAERRLYLPMLGLILVVTEFLRRWNVRPVVLGGVLAGLVAVLAVVCNQRVQVWTSDVVLWEDVIAKSPHNGRAHFQLAVAYSHQGRCADALSRFEAAERLSKPDYTLYVDWALAEDCNGRPDRAIERLRQAAALGNRAYPYSLMGMMYGKQRKYEEALAALETAISIDPKEDTAYLYLGNIYAATGKAADAARAYRRAVDLNPDNETARRGLARVESRAGEP